MKILFISGEGSTLSMALTMQDEGHDVRYYIKLNDNRNVGNGLVNRIDTYSGSVGWADLIIVDDCGFGEQANEWRRNGKAVVGGTKYSDRLEMERGFGQAQMEHYGIKTLKNTEFQSIEEAIRYVEENPKRYVVKLDGKIQEEKSLSYVGKEEDGSDMLFMLQHYREKWGSKIETLQIQDFVDGIEVAVSGFFNGNKFMTPIQVNFEHKKLMNGNIGPSTGEQGTLCIWTEPCKLFTKTIDKFTPKLASEKYVGNFDINCIVDRQGHIWPLETTCRFGYPDITLKLESMDVEDLGEFFYEMAKGTIEEIPVKASVAVGVVVSCAPYPYSSKETFDRYTKGLPFVVKDMDGVYLMDILQKNDTFYIAGDSGYPAVVCGSGDYCDDAIEEAYARIENVYTPNMMYRTDIGKECEKNLMELVDLGVIDRFPYCKQGEDTNPIPAPMEEENDTPFDEEDEE